MKKSILVLVLLLFSVFLAMGSAGAATQLEFGVRGPTPGSIYYTLASGVLTGSFEVDDVTGLGTPSNSGVQYSIAGPGPDWAGGVLSFHTGALQSHTVDTFYPLPSLPSFSITNHTWVFDGGGDISLTGKIAGLGITDPTTTLFSGKFTYAIVSGNGNTFNVVLAEFRDSKSGLLTGAYGLPSLLYLGNMNVSFTMGSLSGDYFTSGQVQSGYVYNTVPVPASLLLLGSGLVGLVGLGRKKLFLKG
jgi:hypothetical protein